jgi:hypothetical protein
MVTDRDYRVEQLLSDGGRIFEGHAYSAVVFGRPTPEVDLEKTNRYVAESRRSRSLYPLRVTGRGESSPSELLTGTGGSSTS